ncbi:di-trans,poly-cis-decaprenylcistransferase [Candidatus Daviesbacteria bacterium]|nr:di-trans,poly-cis-decaprenylcistransferase [Candidatus Daviesbacteria bacterium]
MSKLDSNNIPSHIAIIMDGNRRWARVRHLPDLKGHEEGHEALERTVRTARDFGVQIVTVYALSTENVKERSKSEIAGLFNLLKKTYLNKLKVWMKEGVEIDMLGEMAGLPVFVKKIIADIQKKHTQNATFKLNIAFNYGGKREILQAIEKILKSKVTPKKVSEETLRENLYTNGQPDPELVIRTGGRSRLSNFLLWQTAYSEFYFTKTLWPDFNKKEFKKALDWYKNQKRNFGK